VRWFIRGLSLRVEPSAVFALICVTASFGPGLLFHFPVLAAGIVSVVLVRELAQAVVLARFRPRMIFAATAGETAALRPISTARALTALVAGAAALFYLATVCWMMRISALQSLAFGWGLISLAPIHPLPGGRILALFLPRKLVHWLALPAAAWLMLVAYPSPPAVLIFAVGFLINLGRVIGQPLAIDPTRDDAAEGAAQLERKQFVLAEHTLRDAFDAAPSDHAAAQLAAALIGQGRLDAATQLLEQPAAGPELFWRTMAALFHAARYLEAARVGERSWAMKEARLTAFNLGCTYSRLEEPDVALGWLSRALDVGWRDLAGLDDDPDLAPLRSRPEWAPLRARLTSLGARV
jgi:hypothetical protein